MLKIGPTTKINENSFEMLFSDKRDKRWSARLSNKLEEYDTVDGSECNVKHQINTAAKLITIRILMTYPQDVDNLDELIKFNEQRFKDFYNREVN
ncbi:MAG: hypothetical protein ABFC34_08080 [Methanobacterium sp.]